MAVATQNYIIIIIIHAGINVTLSQKNANISPPPSYDIII